MALTEYVPDLIYYDSQGNEINKDGSKKTTSSNSGWLAGLFGAIPGILSALFPTGVNGSGNTNYPTVTTNPYGQTQVTMAGSNNILIIALVLMAGFILFQGNMLKPAKPTKRK